MRFFRPLLLFYALVLSLVVFFLAFWSSQWWLPNLAPALLERVNVKVESVERTEAGRMRLAGLHYRSHDGLQITADFLEMPNLWGYSRARWFASTWPESQQLELGVVSIQLQSASKPEDSQADTVELPRVIDAADRSFSKIKPWLPPLHIAELSLLSPDGGAMVRAEGFRLEGNNLTAKLYAPDNAQAYPVTLSLCSGKWSLVAAAPHLSLRLQAKLENSKEQLSLDGNLSHTGSSAHFDVAWQGRGMIPDSATFQTEDFPIPQQLLEGVDSSELESIRMSRADVQWDGDCYEGKVEVEANLNVEGHQATAVGVAELEGDTRELRIRAFDVESPWVKAGLETPLVIRLPEAEFEKTADFRVSADLSKQPFFPLAGMLEGRLSFRPPAQMRFELNGRSVVFEGYPASDVILSGVVDKEGLALEKLRAVFAEPAPSEAEISGWMKFEDTLMDFDYDASVSPEWFVAVGLPDLFRETTSLNGKVKGTASAPQWSANWKAPAVQPIGMKVFEANGSASGTGAGGIRIDAELVNQQEQLSFALDRAEFGGGEFKASLERFIWKVDDKTRCELVEPSSFIVPTEGAIARRFEATVIENLVLSGPDVEWSLNKASDGALLFSGHGFQTDWLGTWIEKPIPVYGIRSADVSISQLSPFVAGELSLSATDSAFGLGELNLDLKELRLGESAEVQSLRLALGNEPVLEATADLPIRLEWAEVDARPVLKLDRDGPIRALVSLEPSQTVPEIIRQFSDLTVESPRLKLEINGTAKAPSGHLEAFATTIKLRKPDSEGLKQVDIPDLNEVELRAELDGKCVRLTKLKAAIRGGHVEGSGRWPIEILALFEVSEQADWLAAALRGSFELSFSEWELQNWTPYLPAMLRRTGVLGGTLRHEPDSGFGGALSFKELGLRPTQNLPSVDSANGSLSFDGRTLRVVEAGARVGGSPVALLGQLDFADWPEVSWWAEIEGKNVPVIRRPEMILRSDLDLRLSKERDEPAPNLVGRMGLRSSTMLVEFDPLSPAVRSGPSSKPPFFAIEEEPFNQWGLDLRIEGERFLRVRSPYFQSVLSAGLNLKGRLGEPLLLGSISIDEGSLSFPGAKMQVDAGEAYIESGQPDALQLDVTGTARTGTHVITMDVSGTASDPQIQFDATPPLPNASIVRLLSTGSTTGGGAGSVGLYLGRGLLGAGGMDDNFTDRITIDVGEEKTRSGKNTMGVRYDLNEDVYLNGEYDVYDSYNTDLLWTIFEK